MGLHIFTTIGQIYEFIQTINLHDIHTIVTTSDYFALIFSLSLTVVFQAKNKQLAVNLE